ncbi:MAG: DUF1018 domain-containing protein [Acidobacteria bacterium]|nr:DUF1018 domain-containing protein [Acidobacteriota bacterium]
MPDAKQLKALWSRARERGVDEETLRDLVESVSGQRSLRALNDGQVRRVLDRLGPSRVAPAQRRNAQAKHGRKGYDQKQDPTVLVSPRELRMLEEAAALRHWPAAALERFCERQIKLPKPRTMGEFNKVFWALKSMNRRDGLHA